MAGRLDSGHAQCQPVPAQRKVAEVYSLASNLGESGRVAVSVQMAGGDGTTTDGPYGTAGKWIQTARRKGYLPETQPGKAKANLEEDS
jgi:hypothetical protein